MLLFYFRDAFRPCVVASHAEIEKRKSYGKVFLLRLEKESNCITKLSTCWAENYVTQLVLFRCSESIKADAWINNRSPASRKDLSHPFIYFNDQVFSTSHKANWAFFSSKIKEFADAFGRASVEFEFQVVEAGGDKWLRHVSSLPSALVDTVRKIRWKINWKSSKNKWKATSI